MYQPESLIPSFQFTQDGLKLNHIKSEPEELTENETDNKDWLCLDQKYHTVKEEIEICDTKCNIGNDLQENSFYEEFSLENVKTENDLNSNGVTNISNIEIINDGTQKEISSALKHEKQEVLKTVNDFTFVEVKEYFIDDLQHKIPCRYGKFEANNDAAMCKHISYERSGIHSGKEVDESEDKKLSLIVTGNEASVPSKILNGALGSFTFHKRKSELTRSKQVCHICERRFRKKTTLKKHMNYAHLNIKGCLECDYQAATYHTLKRHNLLVHHPEKVYRCHDCGHASLYKSSLKVHILTKHLCENFKTNIKPNLQEHKSEHISPKYFKCEYCSFESKYKRNLTTHVRDQHIREYRFTCSYCEYKTNVLKHFQKHVNVKHNQIEFICPECGKYKTKFKKYLRVHMLKEHAVKITGNDTSVALRTQVKCTLCSFSAKMPSRVKEHYKQVHSQVRSFPCPHCDYSAKRRACLQSHILHKHEHESGTVRKMHVCHICKTQFYTKFALDNHISCIHLNVKKKCPECDYEARNVRSLKRHSLLVHHPEDLFRCYNCGYATPTKVNLKRHILAMHILV